MSWNFWAVRLDHVPSTGEKTPLEFKSRGGLGWLHQALRAPPIGQRRSWDWHCRHCLGVHPTRTCFVSVARAWGFPGWKPSARECSSAARQAHSPKRLKQARKASLA